MEQSGFACANESFRLRRLGATGPGGTCSVVVGTSGTGGMLSGGVERAVVDTLGIVTVDSRRPRELLPPLGFVTALRVLVDCWLPPNILSRLERERSSLRLAKNPAALRRWLPSYGLVGVLAGTSGVELFDCLFQPKILLGKEGEDDSGTSLT